MALKSHVEMQQFTLSTYINCLIRPFLTGKVCLMKRHPRSQPKGRVPHRSRGLLPWTPHHVVLTVRHDVPPLHRRTIRSLFAVAISKTIEKYIDVSFSLGCMMSDHVHLLAQPKSDQARISVAVHTVRPAGTPDQSRLWTQRPGLSRSILQSRPPDRVRGPRRVALYRAEPGQGGAGETTRRLAGQRSAAVSRGLSGKEPVAVLGLDLPCSGVRAGPSRGPPEHPRGYEKVDRPSRRAPAQASVRTGIAGVLMFLCRRCFFADSDHAGRSVFSSARPSSRNAGDLGTPRAAERASRAH